MKRYSFVIVLLILIFSFFLNSSRNNVYGQATSTGPTSATGTEDAVNQCLADPSKTYTDCLQAGENYLISHHFTVDQDPSATGCNTVAGFCQITCMNGDVIKFPIPTPSPSPTATPTCITTATQQCQNQSCVAGWTQDTTKTCISPSVCCVQQTSSPIPTNTPTPTNNVPPPSGSCPPAQVCNGANASNCCTSGQFCTVGNQGTNVCQNNFAPPPNNPPPNNPPPNNPPPVNTQPPAQPTATPTPPFDQSMCSCDGLNFSSIVAGQPLSVTAYGKVLSANTQYATIPSFDFFFYQGSGTQATIVTNATEKASIFATLPDKVRFKSDWTLNVPANIDPTLTYRIQAKPTCVRKTAMISNLQENRVVLGASTDNSLWGRIVAFFTDLFGGGGKTQPTNQTNNFVTNYSAVTPTEAPKKQNLQLDTFHPANILDSDNCSFIKFGF